MPASYVIGVDLGGTHVRAGLFRSGGKLLRKTEVPTPKHGKKAVLDALFAAVDEIKAPGLKGIGIGMAGIVDHEKGVFKSGPNFPKDLKNVRIVQRLQNRYQVPAFADNDARCFALAEAVKGAGKNAASVFGMTIGTGVGGGLIRNSEIVRGSHAAAGEIGHLPVADELPGHKGGTVDLERVASGTGLARIYGALTGMKVDAKALEDAWRAGDRRAMKAVELGRHALTKGFAAVQLLFDPEIIVVGGGLGKVTDYWKPAAAAAKKLEFSNLKNIKAVPAALGPDAGLIGAATLYEISA